MKLYIERIKDSDEILKRIGLFICLFSNIEKLLSDYLKNKNKDSPELTFGRKVKLLKEQLGKTNDLVKRLERLVLTRNKISHNPIIFDMFVQDPIPIIGKKKNERRYITIKMLNTSIEFSREVLLDLISLSYLDGSEAELQYFKKHLANWSFSFSDSEKSSPLILKNPRFR